MRALVVALAALSVLGLASAVCHRVPHKHADKEFLIKQKKIYELLYHINQPSLYPGLRKLANSFDLEKCSEEFRDPAVVWTFLKYWRSGGFQKRGEQFSISTEYGQRQARILVNLLFNAKTFETFYKTAVWAREYMNEGLFVYAFFSNYYLRNDPYSSVIPGLYDVIPARYLDLGYIVQAWKATLEGKTFNRKHPYVINVNYSSCASTPEEDWVLSYYTQDVIRLAYRDIYHHCNPFWAKWEDYHINRTRRGDYFYFYVKYVLNRYNLERLSNHISDVEPIDYKERVCGVEVDKRLRRYIKTLERRLDDAIDSGYVVDREWKKYSLHDPRSSDIFGSVVEGNGDSINKKYYGSIQRALLDYAEEIIDSCQKYTVGESILNRPSSVLRSPLFYEVFSRVEKILDHYKDKLEPYSHKELWLPGVKVENLAVDDMITFFESWDFELNNAIPVKNLDEASQLMVLARTKRLNHKPFSYRVTVYSEKPKEVRVRFFLGPKTDAYGKELSLNERRRRMLYIDSWVCKLEKGKNDLVRSSEVFDFFEKVPLSYTKLWWLTDSALAGKSKAYLDSFVIRDDHLLLPKGTECGLPVVAYVMVSAYNPKEDSWINPSDGLTTFPFDRRIKNEWEFSVANARFCGATIYHRDSAKRSPKTESAPDSLPYYSSP